MSEAPLEAARASALVRAGEPLHGADLGGRRLGLPAGRRAAARGARLGSARELRPARGRGRGRGARAEPLRAARRAAAGRAGGACPRAATCRSARATPATTLAERLAPGDYAAAHTASDQAETVLYRLAVSPGSRALHGMAARRGRLVRPLLGATREEVRDYLRARGLEWREDPSNADRRFARARVRHDLLAALREVGPAPERTIAATAAQLRDEAELLDRAVDAALEELGGGPAVSLSALREQPPALRRLVLRRLAGDRPVPDEVLELDERGSSSLDLGDGLRAVAEYGTLRFTCAADPRSPSRCELTVPGRARFGSWELEAALDRRWRRGGVGGGARRLGDRALVARGRPHAPARRSAAARRSRTCSPTARSRARCGARCPWSRSAARSPGWRAWRSTSASRCGRASRASGCPARAR